MDKALLDEFRTTDYLVCLDEVEVAPAHSTIAPGIALPPTSLPSPAPATLAHPWATWASIRIDQSLPESLQTLVGARSWGFITAWNPRSERRVAEDNLTAQRELLTALRSWPEAVIYPAIGIGTNGWSEPSLFIIGLDTAALDALGQRHEQNAYVHGHGNATASLRLLRS
ncbi:DUF3293 domain-containing protein [Rhodanobacter sp. C03]|uniref:DUF3293 domain-containing protein n=1 Tax=Rhodanobacter sp. C03 TaxID=1945858 RepID=UPI0009865503|nr:DUF3293 domain-containing protein [Rhodanobacter sp. C03]OOG57222.1 hypothetical protein B0E48_07085 [Rhodanobacter sp. C03]